MSARNLEAVHRKSTKRSEHVQRQHAPSDHTACAGWAMPQTCKKKLLTTQSTTVSHGCARSIHVVLSETFVASRSRSTLSVWSHAALRLVPIRLCKRFSLARLNIITVVVSHTETVSPFQILRCLQRFRESVCCVR